jgi:hypothetical protein
MAVVAVAFVAVVVMTRQSGGKKVVINDVTSVMEVARIVAVMVVTVAMDNTVIMLTMVVSVVMTGHFVSGSSGSRSVGNSYG